MLTSKHISALLLFSLVALNTLDIACAENKKINNTNYQVSEQNLDRELRLKKILLFPSVDDLSGVLAPQLDEKLLNTFLAHPRFEIIRNPEVVHALGSDDSAYLKVAQSEQVHKEAARISSADATIVLRTRTVAGSIEMNLDCRDASGRLIYSESGAVLSTATTDARTALVAQLINTWIKKIPFIGTVSGRTGQTITIDLGQGEVQIGDSLEIVKLISVQRHPLLGVVVASDYAKVGTAKITSIDRVLSFAEISSEMPGETIRPDNKIILVHQSEAQKLHLEPRKSGEESEKRFEIKRRSEEPERLSGDFDQEKPRFGMVYLDLMYGSLSHNQTVSNINQEISGSGISGALGGELWITKNWIFGLDISSQSASLDGQQNGADITAGSTSRRDFDIVGGYRLFPAGLSMGSSVTLSLGYQSVFVSLPDNSNLSLSQKKYTGIFARIGAEMNLNNKNKVLGAISIQPFSSLADPSPYLGSPDSATNIGVEVFWAHEVADNLWLRFGLKYATANGTYDNNATVADKKFAIGPGVSYSF